MWVWGVGCGVWDVGCGVCVQEVGEEYIKIYSSILFQYNIYI